MAVLKSELESLIAWTAQPGDSVLSVYLDVNQSRPGNLHRGHVRPLKDLLRSSEQKAGENDRKQFAAAAERALEFVSNHDARGHTLVIFSGAGGFFWQRELHIPIEPVLRWEDKPYVRPLVEAMDEYERYGVVVAGREKARLFTVYLGQVEGQRDVGSPEKRKTFKSASKDTTLSQPNLQRREEEHALWHLKEVAAELEQLQATHRLDRLILAGPHEITSELHRVLPKRLQSLVVRSIALPPDAGDAAVLKETMRIEEEVEREGERELVERLITAASKDTQGVLGMQPTLDAMRLGRIRDLVYVHGLAAAGVQCVNCQSLFAGAPAACGYCGGELRPIPDIVSRLADLVFYSDGHAENVRGEAAGRLEGVGRIGAFLRF